MRLRHLAPALLLVFAQWLAPAESVKNLPAPTGFIDDYANVLTPGGHAELEAVCREVHARTRAQIFLVTVHTLAGVSKEEFANKLFAQWKIGERKTDRGILILLAINDHKRWIEVGYGFEGILNDAKVGDIGREMVPLLKAADYDGAARVGVDDIARVIAADSKVTLVTLTPLVSDPAPQPVMVAPPPPHDGTVSDLIGIFLFIATLGLIIGFATANRTPRRRLFYNPILPPNPYDPLTGPLPANDPAPYLAGSDSGLFSGSSDSSSSSFTSPSDTFTGGDGGASGGGGAGGDW